MAILGWTFIAALLFGPLILLGAPAWTAGLLLIALWTLPGLFALINWYRD